MPEQSFAEPSHFIDGRKVLHAPRGTASKLSFASQLSRCCSQSSQLGRTRVFGSRHPLHSIRSLLLAHPLGSFRTVRSQPQAGKLKVLMGEVDKRVQATESDSAGADLVDKFCRGANDIMAKTVFPQIRERVAIREETSLSQTSPWERLLLPPESPGIPRPVWLVIAASVPTFLGWYGYYKFSVEEELFQDEIRRTGRATGCGGYGTLFPFVWCVLLGGIGKFVFDAPGADAVISVGSLWILLGQVNLYRRVNELFEERGEDPPVYAWWALLPPPLDVVVGLRQVHFLAKYWSEVRGMDWEEDVVAETYFPFISTPRFTLKEFVRDPSIWFWFTRDWKPFWEEE